jgi:peroxiredoxin Q/BCP
MRIDSLSFHFRPLVVLGALLGGLATLPASAALHVGDQAPDFSTQASLGGKVFTFSLADALKQGPVVLYFYPAAYTKGCTIEAHDFADAVDRYKELGATVIGVSRDNLATLDKFSVSDCRSKFAVASDGNGRVTTAYDVVLASKPELADRVSYVIGTDGKIKYEYASLSPDEHVANTLDAVEKLKSAH